jgi:hypothetical protein
MAQQPLLALRSRGGSTPAVFRLIGSTASAVGNTFGTAEDAGSNALQHCSGNRVIQFANNLYAWVGDTVVKYNSGTTNWDTKLTLSPVILASAKFLHTGLHSIMVNNVKTMVGVYCSNNASQPIYAISSTDGTSWTTTSTGTNSGMTTASIIGVSVVYRNILFFLNSIWAVASWDPSTSTFTTQQGTLQASSAARDLCVYQNKLFTMQSTGNNAAWTVFEWTASNTWTSRYASASLASTSNFSACRPILHTAGDGYMYMWMSAGASGNSTHCRKLQYTPSTSTLAEVADLSTIVVPTAIRTPNVQTTQFVCVYDQETTTGALNLLIYYAPNNTAGTNWTCFQWNGGASEATQLDTGSDVTLQLPGGGDAGGGARIWTSGEPDVSIEGFAAASTGLQVSFILYGSGTKSFALFFSATEETPLVQCTLASPSAGSLNGQQVDSLTADGSTVYTVIWTFTSDAQTTFSRERLVPRIF